MGVDVANGGMVQLVSPRASRLVYIYFLLGLWPSCSHSHLAPWACHVKCVYSNAAQVLSFLFLGVPTVYVYVVGLNSFALNFHQKVCYPTASLTMHHVQDKFRINPKICCFVKFKKKTNRPFCTTLHYLKIRQTHISSTLVILSIKWTNTCKSFVRSYRWLDV